MHVTTLKKAQFKALLFYTKLEGWDSEETHLRSLYKSHPNDFFVLIHEEKIVGFVVAIRYSQRFGFISSFLVLKEFRFRGFGTFLFEHALERLKDCQIALDSVKNKQSFYKKYGFKSYFNVTTYKFIVGSAHEPKSDFEVVNFYEKLSLVGLDEYMKSMIRYPTTNYKAIKKANAITSFAFSFKYVDGYKIHIESDDLDETIALFFALVKEFKDASVAYVQVTKLSPVLVELVKLLNMSEHSKLVRMYNKILE